MFDVYHTRIVSKQQGEMVAKTLHVYKSNLGTFVRTTDMVYSESYYKPENWRFNGLDKQFSSLRGYILLEGIHEITSLEGMTSATNKRVGYKLTDPNLASEKIPLQLSMEDVDEYLDDEDDLVWRNYNALRSLYEVVYEQVPGKFKHEEFTVNVIQTLNIENLTDPVQMKVSLHHEGSFGQAKVTESDLSSVVCYEDFERMLTPEFLLHERPCHLTSEQVYKIVRDYVKKHINGAYARITSDYDFCFTVKRVVRIKPYTDRREIHTPKGNSYKPPRFKPYTVSEKLVEIFEMTHTGKMYQGYTAIEGWRANNLVEMKEQIETYLNDLMDVINSPVQECSHCNGTGYIIQDKLGTNNRKIK